MAFSPRLELKQGQALVMTPQLQQAIKLLQLSHLDLAAYVQEELERNPLLEQVEGGAGANESNDADAAETRERTNHEESANQLVSSEDTGLGELDLGEHTGASQAALDGGQDNLYADEQPAPAAPPALTDSGWSSIGSGSSRGFDSDEFSLEAMLSHEPTLTEHLTEQLVLAVSDPVQRVIGQHLIHLIDDDGYLRADLGELADQLGTSTQQIEEVVKIMQGFEPVGVFGRDLAECLAIQLKEKDRLDPAMQSLLANVDLLARREFSALRKICSVDEEDLADMIAEIRCLDPRPAQQFTAHVAEPVVPDVIVQPRADGTWHVELNADTLPRVLVNQSYYATVAKGAKNAKDKAYLSDCLQSANWLVKSIDQRARTILKVASEIVRQQDAFLVYGVEHLRPLTLRTIADAISMHESTISRVTSNKYMATPRGIFELKFFFTTAISSADGGEAHSAEAVRHKIRQMIDQEAANAVLSDDQLVRQLRAEGVDIARRTVAKYRESLKIPSSVQRRREKRQPA